MKFAIRRVLRDKSTAGVMFAGWFCAALLWSAISGSARGEELWDYTPYRVRVWLAPGPTAGVTPRLWDDVAREIEARSEAVFGATWHVRIEPTPADFLTEAALRMEALDVAEMARRAQLTGKRAKKPPADTKATPKPKTPPATAPAGESGGGTSPTTSTTGTSTTDSDSATPQGAKTGVGETGAGVSTAGVSESTSAGSTSSEGSATRPDASARGSSSAPSREASPKPADPPEDPLKQSLRELFQEDKLFVVAIVADGLGWKIRVRELDCRSRTWTEVYERSTADLALAPNLVWQTMENAFRAVARLESAKDKMAVWRLRAAGLVSRPDSPVAPGVNSIWRPYVRMNDRGGEPRGGFVPPVPWSFGVVKEVDGTKIKTDYVTGVKNPLTGKVISRTQRFALRVRATGQSTLIKLRSSEKGAETLSGYDILAKEYATEGSELMGRTDWRGAMEIPASDFPVRVLYVKNGNQLLARLPLMPGLEPELIVDMKNDDRRLQAEGYLTGLQGQIMDLVARRSIVATRLKRRVNEGNTTDAAKIMDEFRALPSKDDLIRQIDLAQVRLATPDNKRSQEKIDKMFNDTRKLLDKFVDGKLQRELESMVAQAGAISAAIDGATGGSSSTPPTPAPAPAPAGDGRAPAAPSPAPSGPPTGPPTGPPGAGGPGAPMGVPPGGAPGGPPGAPSGPPGGAPGGPGGAPGAPMGVPPGGGAGRPPGGAPGAPMGPPGGAPGGAPMGIAPGQAAPPR